jgi:hypothetical protein
MTNFVTIMINLVTTMINLETIIIMINMLMSVKLNSFTHLRALLVLHARGILAHATSATSKCIPSGWDHLRPPSFTLHKTCSI